MQQRKNSKAESRTWTICTEPSKKWACLSHEKTKNNESVNSTRAQPPPPPPHPGYCGAFACLVSPGGGAFANFVLPGGRAFANPRAIPELLTRTRFATQGKKMLMPGDQPRRGEGGWAQLELTDA